jgi:DNA-directed RNA polymerase beta' subunit
MSKSDEGKMIDSIYDRINDYGSVSIRLASPNDIRSWSFGEVRKPETINYRTYRPEKDGLFCERIFGPERDWECTCGKYKGTKFKGIICDRCGVKVTHSRVRRKRMGHINLAAPVVHIWFFKSMPSRLGALLAMKTTDLEKVIYFQDYVVTDPGATPLKLKQLLTEAEYRDTMATYGSSFKALMGAEAVKELLCRPDLNALGAELKEAINRTTSKQKIRDLGKRIKVVNMLLSSNNRPEWMVFDVVPVIPPDLRPLVLLESGNFATSDLNDLYRRIINRNNRLKKLIDLNAPEVIIRNEKRMLQQAVDALFDNGRCRRPVLGSNNRPLKSLADMIKGKQGRFRENLLGKRVDYSARSVIVVGPHLKLHQCGLPKKIALELYQPFIIRKLKERGLADTIKSAKRMLERQDEHVWDILEEVIHQHPVLLNRAPTLHRMGIQAFEPVLVEGNAIMIHPLVCRGFNADFDGDQMAVHLPLSIEAQVEAHTLMLSPHNIFSPANGSPIVGPSQDIVLGNYYITVEMPGAKGEGMIFRDTFEAITAYDIGRVSIHARITVGIDKSKKILTEEGEGRAGPIETTAGRCIFNDILPPQMPFYNIEMSQKGLGQVINDCYKLVGSAATIELLDHIKELGFKHATLAGLSFGITDLKVPPKKQAIIEETQKKVDRINKNYQTGVITEGERYNQIIDAWTHARVAVTNEMMQGMKNDTRDEDVPIDDWLKTSIDDWLKTSEGRKWVKENQDDLRKKYLVKGGERTGGFAFKYVVTEKAGKALSAGELHALEGKLASEYPYKDKQCPRLNDWKRLSESFEKWDDLSNCPKANVRLAPILAECNTEIKSESGWTHVENIDEVVALPEKDEQGIYFFKCLRTGSVKDGYIGIGGEEKADKPSAQGLKNRLRMHFKARFNPDTHKKISECGDNLLEKWASMELTYLRESGKYPSSRRPYLNPIYLMSDSGARGSVDQIQQLAGMRALMAKPSGEIIETPIKSNFREGMTVLEYFSSTHGARKGLADTALKTADSGYLTRKLADVAQNVIVTEHNCGTLQGITKSTVYKGEQVDVPLRQLIIGRTARDNIRNPMTDEMIIRENEVITSEAAEKIEALGLDAIRVRSPLTCDSLQGMCVKCYGWDMSTGRLVEEGLAAGIIAAQSIGEPGTQLTMRTFHTGGVASRTILESDQKAPQKGFVKFRDLNVVPDAGQASDAVLPKEVKKHKLPEMSKGIVLKRSGEITLLDEKGRELERFKVPYGAVMQVGDGQEVSTGQRLFSWDPHRTPILAEVSGIVRLVDIVDGETIRIEEERRGQSGRPVIIEHKGDKHPQIIIEDSQGKILDVHYLPAKARIEVTEGQEVQAGQLLARQPRATGGTQDITGGLPRVTEIFEARKPKEPAAMAEISGKVELKSDKRRGKMTVTVRSESGMQKEHHIPRDRHLLVVTGDTVEAGDRLSDGPLVPHDILRIKGEETLQRYLLTEIQNVYRSQNVNINDKHIEIILSQMMRKVEIESIGDSGLLPGEVVDKLKFRQINAQLAKRVKITDLGDASDFTVDEVVSREDIERVNERIEILGGTPAKAKSPKSATANTLLLGITKASLQSDSFISAASFQETTKVLTEASIAGKVDVLIGLKENVILGHLIPAGTGFRRYVEMRCKRLAAPPLPKVLAELKEVKEEEAKKEAAVKEALGIR